MSYFDVECYLCLVNLGYGTWSVFTSRVGSGDQVPLCPAHYEWAEGGYSQPIEECQEDDKE